MTTKLLSRLAELDNRPYFLKDKRRTTVYGAVAEKANVDVRDIVKLAYDGPHSVNHVTAQRIIAAVGIVQGKAIEQHEMLMLFENDAKTNERNNAGAMARDKKRWL